MKKVVSMMVILCTMIMMLTGNGYAERTEIDSNGKTSIGDVWNVICEFTKDGADTVVDATVTGWNATKDFTVDTVETVEGWFDKKFIAPRIIVDGVELEYGSDEYNWARSMFDGIE